LFKKKISVLRSKISTTARAKSGLLDREHITTNLVKFIKVLTNITTAEANIYRAELENIFNGRSVTIVEHKCKPCAIVNDSDSAGNLQWFNVNTSDTNWIWMWCLSCCKVC
jgi:hypothetical protein